MRSPVAIALVLLAGIVPAVAVCGTVAPGLERLLAQAAPDQDLRVLVVLRDQADLAALDADLRAAKAGPGERHRRVIEALRAAADNGQERLAADLAAAKSVGRIRGAVSHWLINAIVVTARPDAIRDLALHPDVDRIEADLVAELIAPAAVGLGADVGTADKDEGVGLAAGVAAVGAPRVWRELGIDGTGVVVGILDTGVDGAHPALAGRWRGTVAPAAECWFDGAGLGDATPVDRHYHGTHVMGILAGMAPGDTIGVAPGALWIASNVINHPGPQDAFDNAVIASLEFMADPDGDPATTDDVPAVVHNSWGISEALGDYLDCDSRWWDAMDAVEAAGVVLTWSAGNEGPTAGTVRSPADRARTALDAFAVGSTTSLAPFAVSSFSSRGPSGCGGADAVKPEVVAPGEDILSARPGGGYRYLSGTSMAGPHVAGIVALMRAASPAASVDEIKQALLDTARDLGDPGQDNAAGWGLVDAYGAVASVMAGVGEVTGVVRGAADGAPVAGAVLQLDGGLHRAETGADGRFRFVLPAGAARFTVTAFGYFDDALEAIVPDGGAVDADVSLVPRVQAVISGHVLDGEGAPVPGATVTAEGAPLVPAVADSQGAYALSVPAGTELVYALRARADGFGNAAVTVAVPADVTVDFTLPPPLVEDFESGGLAAFAWRSGGEAAWAAVAEDPWQGAWCARSGLLAPLGISRLERDVAVLGDGVLVFRVRTSSEPGYDALRFYVDGVLRASWSGETAWTTHTEFIASGTHTLAWAYEKDGSVDAGEDAAWIDAIEFPDEIAPPRPRLHLDRTALGLVLAPGGSGEALLTVANTGDAALDLTVFAGAPPALPPAIAHVDLGKGDADPRPASGAAASAGGPDRFGYAWCSSDEPCGPAYAWRDISASGHALGLGDDDVSAPVPLDFTFPFYGAGYASVRVAANGFLLLGDAAVGGGTWLNQGLPDPAAPNALVAPFWDDLAPDRGGSVHVLAEPDRLTVQFSAVPHYAAPAMTESFQVILDRDGTIVFQYASVGDDGGCTVGIEDGAGQDGLLVQFNNRGALHAGLALRMAVEQAPAWLTVTPSAATVAPGQQTTVTVAAAAGALAPGDYEAWLRIASDDPGLPLAVVPVLLTVEQGDRQAPMPAVPTFAGAVPNPFNPSTELRFVLPRPARVTLDVHDLAGRRVRRLVADDLGPGPHAVPWDGRDGRGRRLASGAYQARLTVDGDVTVRPVMLLR